MRLHSLVALAALACTPGPAEPDPSQDPADPPTTEDADVVDAPGCRVVSSLELRTADDVAAAADVCAVIGDVRLALPADDVTLPIEGTCGQNVRVCITSVQDSDGEATVVMQTTAGDVRVALKRDGVLSSVEEDLTVIEGLQVSPNPMRDELVIRSASLQPLTVHVHSVVGNRLVTLNGTGEARWDGRDLSGARLAAGVYVLVIEQGLSTQVVKVIVE